MFCTDPRALRLLHRVIVEDSVDPILPSTEVNAHHLLEAGFAHIDSAAENIVIDEALPEVAITKWFAEHPRLTSAVVSRMP